MKAYRHSGESPYEVGPVAVVSEERSLVEGSNHDMMERARGIQAWAARHVPNITGI